MSSWQKRARLAVGVFGVAVAVVVYLALGERNSAAPPRALERLDPKAVIESTTALLQQARESEQDFEVKAERTLSYEDGSTKQFGVRISVRKKNGRDFVVTTREAQAGANQRDLQLSGEVKLTASDGFELTTERASFNQDNGIVQAPAQISFKKGRLSGSGTGMTYDKNTDVLNVLDQALVTVADEAGATTMSFMAHTAALDRVQDFVTLDGGTHVLRGKEVLDSTTATAHLSADEQIVTLIELRGNSRVVGGAGTLESMTARDIDLDYSDDGQLLERVLLTGTAVVALAPVQASSGRRLAGETLDLQLASDGSLTHASGRDNVRLDLPAAGDAPARGITSKAFDATGQPGAGLTDAHFEGDVEYNELAGRDSPHRVARSKALQVSLTQNDVRNALFTGGVTFEERGLSAISSEARYDPEQGSLQLSSRNAGAVPRVSDEQVAVAGPAIDVALQTRRIEARGGVKTTLAAGESSKSGVPQEGATRLPGLLKQDKPANVNADAVVYEGAASNVTYSGNATLWQGETAIRGEVIRIDQEKGDLVATGEARSTLALDGGQSVGRAHQIRYENAHRVISYEPAPPSTPGRGAALAGKAAARTGASTPTGAPVPPGRAATTMETKARAQLSGPQGDLQADRIEVVLAPQSNEFQRLEAHMDVRLKIDTRTARGARLTYHADEERYVLTGTATEPVKVVESCRETTGKTLIFFRSTDRILVDGNEEIRTQTKGGGPCSQPSSRER